LVLSKTSKLDAVNSMLAAIGQSPVNSLDQSTVDVASALQFLDKASREVQTEGWKFNTEQEYALTINNDGEIPLADNVAAVSLDPFLYPTSTYNVVIRGNRLYNMIGSTFEFTASLTGKAVLLLDWDDLPEHVRSYVLLRARREFQNDFQGSDSANAVQSRDELQAFIKMKKMEGWGTDTRLIDSFMRHNGYRL